MKTSHSIRSSVAGIALASLLAACGGGGGGDTVTVVTPPATTFAFGAGYRARAVTGATDNFNLSGSCAGTASISTAAAAASTFEGVAGYSSAQVSTVNFTNCLPASATASGATYFNAGYVPIGLAISGGEYAKFDTALADLPASVKVGDSGQFASMTTYSDSSKTATTGKRIVSYSIEADTTTTAVANVITQGYDAGNQLLSTQQSRYRMTTAGALTLLSIDVQFSGNSTIHLIYTPK